jgi:hypothetical protein
MKIELRTGEDKMLPVNVTGTTVFNTDDYTELKGKTIGEIKQMDLEELLELKTNDGTCLVNTMEYGTYVHDEGLDVRDLDGCETEITTIG